MGNCTDTQFCYRCISSFLFFLFFLMMLGRCSTQLFLINFFFFSSRAPDPSWRPQSGTRRVPGSTDLRLAPGHTTSSCLPAVSPLQDIIDPRDQVPTNSRPDRPLLPCTGLHFQPTDTPACPCPDPPTGTRSPPDLARDWSTLAVRCRRTSVPHRLTTLGQCLCHLVRFADLSSHKISLEAAINVSEVLG